MAINFPSTVGQATDGTFTYVVAGITYSWDGSSWSAAGAGASATDRTLFSVTQNAAGSASLSYNSNSGVFSYTPPDLSSYMTTSNGGAGSGYDADLLDGQQGVYYLNAGNLTAGTVSSDRLSGTYNIDITGSAASASSAGFGIGGLTDVTISSASTNQVLTYNGSQWVNSTPAAVSGLASRTTASAQTGQISDGVATYLTISAAPTYALHKIETSVAAWVTVYTDTTSRSNDSTRLEYTDPVPGSGVIAEVITTGNIAQTISPGTIGWSETSGGSSTSDVYLKVVNKSGGLNAVVVTLYYVPLEV